MLEKGYPGGYRLWLLIEALLEDAQVGLVSVLSDLLVLRNLFVTKS